MDGSGGARRPDRREQRRYEHTSTSPGAVTAAAEGRGGCRWGELRVTNTRRAGVLLGRVVGLAATLVCVSCVVWAT